LKWGTEKPEGSPSEIQKRLGKTLNGKIPLCEEPRSRRGGRVKKKKKGKKEHKKKDFVGLGTHQLSFS